jgi:dGTPase
MSGNSGFQVSPIEEGLKPYAVSSANSRGREHPEQLGRNADPYAIDRERVLHSAAFRRLARKTQVFVTGEHDHLRTRLTHTLEVTSVVRRLCAALQVNGAVGELIALAHDLGHPPFGHAGEVTLHKLMVHHGGFEHNAQSLRIVEYLEHPYPAFRGLNLMYEVRESLAKHCTIFDRPGIHPLADGSQAPLEGQIANLADRVAYDCHDLEDAIGAGLLEEGDLKTTDLWAEAAGPVRREYGELSLAAVRRPILDRLEAILLEDIVAESRRRIVQAGPSSLDETRACPEPLVSFSADMQPRIAGLESFLVERVYRHSRLIRMDDKAGRLIEQLFNVYLGEPKLLPPRFSRRVTEQGLHRVLCDYISGMTDRFCQEEYRRLFEPFETV